jgi:hypothetical protein
METIIKTDNFYIDIEPTFNKDGEPCFNIETGDTFYNCPEECNCTFSEENIPIEQLDIMIKKLLRVKNYFGT